MTASRYGTATVDDLAQLCAELARDEVVEIMDETKPADLTACEMVALLRILRPPLERKRAAPGSPRPSSIWCNPAAGRGDPQTVRAHDEGVPARLHRGGRSPHVGRSRARRID